MKEFSLLIGNGLNRASAKNSAWVDMLDGLRKKYQVEHSGGYTNMPLEFERIYLNALKQGKVNRAYSVKKEIVNFLPDITDLSLYSGFWELPINKIMTTNYDYYIEKSINARFERKNVVSNTKERKNSLFRHIHVYEKQIWHIHGEAHCPASICLGYDHYCTYLSNMIGYLTQPIVGISNRPLLRYIMESGNVSKYSWPLLFFNHDIFILGLSMSFLEIDLWWLLSYRRRFMLENPQYNISNRIHYFYASYSGSIEDEQISLLESTGVILHPISLVRGNWKKLYLDILMKIKEIINQG